MRRRTRKRKRVIRGTSGNPSSGNNQKREREKKRGFLHKDKDSHQNIIYNGPLLTMQQERTGLGKLWNFYSMESLRALTRIIIIREAAEQHGEEGANIITSNEKETGLQNLIAIM